MDLLYVLEKLRMPVLNEFMLLITRLGEETAFLVVALVVFWCVDKRKGYYIMTVGFLGTILNQFLKLLCRVPRPWIIDPQFAILEQAREAATGYSFPSGHTQNAVGTFGGLAYITQRKWAKGIFIAVAALVSFSRMYIGVHTPYDVFASAAIALGLLYFLRPMTISGNDRIMKIIIPVMLVLAVGLVLYVECFPFPADIDAHNLESGMKNAYTMIGCLTGVCVVYVAEKKYVNFETKASWWAQIFKVVLGLILVLLVKEGMRAPLEMVFSLYAARAVRYFLIVLTAGLLWPMTFRWFSKLGVKK